MEGTGDELKTNWRRVTCVMKAVTKDLVFTKNSEAGNVTNWHEMCMDRWAVQEEIKQALKNSPHISETS